jgi:hypothetical protein
MVGGQGGHWPLAAPAVRKPRARLSWGKGRGDRGKRDGGLSGGGGVKGWPESGRRRSASSPALCPAGAAASRRGTGGAGRARARAPRLCPFIGLGTAPGVHAKGGGGGLPRPCLAERPCRPKWLDGLRGPAGWSGLAEMGGPSGSAQTGKDRFCFFSKYNFYVKKI